MYITKQELIDILTYYLDIAKKCIEDGDFTNLKYYQLMHNNYISDIDPEDELPEDLDDWDCFNDIFLDYLQKEIIEDIRLKHIPVDIFYDILYKNNQNIPQQHRQHPSSFYDWLSCNTYVPIRKGVPSHFKFAPRIPAYMDIINLYFSTDTEMCYIQGLAYAVSGLYTHSWNLRDRKLYTERSYKYEFLFT